MERESFILYSQHVKRLHRLTDAEAGQLFKAIVAYTQDEADCDAELTVGAGVLYDIIVEQLDKDADKYEKTKQARSEAGKSGGRPKKEEDTEKQKKQMVSEEKQKKQMVSEEKQTKAKKAVNVNVNENVNVNGNEIGDSKGEDELPQPPQSKPQVKAVKEPKFPHGEFMNVMLTADEYSKLTDRYGPKRTDEYCEKLSAYLKGKGKDPYKDHYAVILQWLRKDNIPESGSRASPGKASGLISRALQQMAAGDGG